VDVYSPKGVKVGKTMEEGFRVNRKYPDFRVRQGCEKYINNNRDCWSRGVLAKSYQTFVGGHNFVEHVQIEDLSKGRIIDAVSRDIGDSVYVDILIATERKHRDLVAAVQSGDMGTLSMGCTVDGTICTKCGHWASDETEMCPHIKYQKGNTFFDKEGRQNIIAELCGHEDLDPTGGVRFIEASWVGLPAFSGAVLRNVIEPTAEMSRQAQAILASPPTQWSKNDRMKAAANSSIFSMAGLPQMAGDWDMPGEEEGAPAEEPKPETPDNPLKGLEDELTQALLDKVKKRVKDSIQGPDEGLTPEQSSSTNDNLQRLAGMYQQTLGSIARTASSDVEMVDRVADFHQSIGFNIPVSVYRTLLKVGALHGYSPQHEFLVSCRKSLGRSPTKAEAGAFLRLGKLLSHVGRGQGPA
jgi:hypothetical protein